MRSYRIVLHYTDASKMNGHPETWDWWDLLDVGVEEVLSVELVEDMETPYHHQEELQQA